MWELYVTMKAVNKLDTQLFAKTCNKRTEGQSVSEIGRKQVGEMSTSWVIQEFIARGGGGIDLNSTTFKTTYSTN